jgi:hypothetical protein
MHFVDLVNFKQQNIYEGTYFRLINLSTFVQSSAAEEISECNKVENGVVRFSFWKPMVVTGVQIREGFANGGDELSLMLSWILTRFQTVAAILPNVSLRSLFFTATVLSIVLVNSPSLTLSKISLNLLRNDSQERCKFARVLGPCSENLFEFVAK